MSGSLVATLRRHPLRRCLPVALLIAGAALAACGGDDAGEDVTPASVASTVTADAAVTTTGAPTTEGGAPATTLRASTTAAPISDERATTDLHGPITVPAAPQRVIVMEDQTLGNLLAIGFPLDRIVGYPLGIGGSFANSPELAELVDPSDLNDIGQFTEPNLEAIAALEPDLILTAGIVGDAFYDDLRASLQQLGVPVFVVTNGYTSFDEAMTMLEDTGRAVGYDRQAAEVEAGLRERVAALQAEVAAADLPDTGYVRLNRRTAAGSVYVEASPWLTLLGVPGPRPSLEEYAVDYADELLDEALAGYQLLFVAERIEDGDFVARLEGNPLWNLLPAVQNGEIHVVSENTWKAYSAPAISWILDDIERVLLP